MGMNVEQLKERLKNRLRAECERQVRELDTISPSTLRLILKEAGNVRATAHKGKEKGLQLQLNEMGSGDSDIIVVRGITIVERMRKAIESIRLAEFSKQDILTEIRKTEPNFNPTVQVGATTLSRLVKKGFIEVVKGKKAPNGGRLFKKK